MRVPCGTALDFSVESPCPPKMTILRLCYCMAICQISSFVSEACDAASASSALSAFAELTWGLVGRRQVWEAPGALWVVFDSTLQLWLRALMSRAIALIRSRSCPRSAPVTAGSGRETGPESAECGAEVSGVPSNIYGWRGHRCCSASGANVWVAAEEGPDDCRWRTCCSPSRSLGWLGPILACLGMCRLTPPTELPPSWGSSIPTSARPPAVARCEVSCPFCWQSARRPCCTAEEAGPSC